MSQSVLNDHKNIKNNRLTELMNILDEIEGKAVIWAHFQHDVKNIIKEIQKVHGPRSVVDYYGLTPKDIRQNKIGSIELDKRNLLPTSILSLRIRLIIESLKLFERKLTSLQK